MKNPNTAGSCDGKADVISKIMNTKPSARAEILTITRYFKVISLQIAKNTRTLLYLFSF